MSARPSWIAPALLIALCLAPGEAHAGKRTSLAQFKQLLASSQILDTKTGKASLDAK